MTANNNQIGIVYILLSAFCFALMNLFIRLAGDVPTLQKCFFRNFFALLIAIFSLVRAKTPFMIQKGNLKYLLARSISGGLGMVCNFYAIDHIPISDASILNKLSPFFAIIFSIYILNEKANFKEMLAVVMAFIGALFVIKPTISVEIVPALAGAIGGFGAGLAYAFVRKLGVRGENSMIVVAFFSGFTTLMLAPVIILDYRPMSIYQWIFLILTGIAAAGGQICITRAYSYAAAKEISVYDFSIVIFSAILGFIFLNQVPDWLSIIGYIIIIGTALTKWYFTVVKMRVH